MMRWKRNKQQKRSGIDLAEEALFLLRHSSAPIISSYLVGTVPFVLGLLYFWTDMSRSAVASQHLGQAAFAMCALYIWMKFWHSIFAINLFGRLSGSPPERYSWSRIFRIVTTQLSVQPYGLFVIPFCVLALIPFPWALMFFHTFALTGDGNHSDLRSAIKRSWSLANLWPGQSHVFVFLMLAFSVCIFAGVGILILFIPQLIQALFGIETVLTQAGIAASLNSTFFAVVAGITFLCVNPIMKTASVLRAFYGEALQTGADLQAELRTLPAVDRPQPLMRSRKMVVAIVLISLLFEFVNVYAEPAKIPPEQLDQSIEKVIHQREYQWRIPRDEKDLKNDNSLLVDFLLGVNQTLGEWLAPVKRFLGKAWNWILRKLFPNRTPTDHKDPGELSDQSVLLIALITFAATLLAILFYRFWKKRQKEEIVLAEEISAVVPDLEDENTIADQYPEEGWLSLAREYMERGELRLALRALYLSSLALLSRRGLITITKYKSNREYDRELQRKAQRNEDLLLAFQENLSLFERSWYGRHEVNTEILDRFNQNQERIRSIA
jgi:hypothetical protein